MKIITLLTIIIFMISCQKEAPRDSGFKNGLFAACSGYSCFSSTDINQKNKIDSIKYREPRAEVLNEVKKYAMLIGEGKVLQETDNYLHIEYKGFFNTDDLEVFINDEAKTIEYIVRARSSFDFGSTKTRAHDLGFKYIQRGM